MTASMYVHIFNNCILNNLSNRLLSVEVKLSAFIYIIVLFYESRELKINEFVFILVVKL